LATEYGAKRLGKKMYCVMPVKAVKGFEHSSVYKRV
jgi:hypothetical protein